MVGLPTRTATLRRRTNVDSTPPAWRIDAESNVTYRIEHPSDFLRSDWHHRRETDGRSMKTGGCSNWVARVIPSFALAVPKKRNPNDFPWSFASSVSIMRFRWRGRTCRRSGPPICSPKLPLHGVLIWQIHCGCKRLLAMEWQSIGSSEEDWSSHANPLRNTKLHKPNASIHRQMGQSA